VCLLHCFLEVSCFSPVPLDKWGVVSYASCDHIRVNIMTDSFFTAIQSLDAIMTRVITASINKCCPRLTRTALTFTVWGRAPYICTNTAEKIYRSCQEHVTLTLHLPLPLVAVCYVHTHTHTRCVCVCVRLFVTHLQSLPAWGWSACIWAGRKENTHIPNFMKIRSVEFELFLRTDGRT